MPESLEVKVVVVTADQIRSRQNSDRVPDALATMHRLALGDGSRKFARTAGDEIQGLLTEAGAAIRAIEELSRLGDWRIGVGVGTVVRPLPRDVRAATGEAFVAAREALVAAHSAPQDLRVAASDNDAAADLEAALWMLRAIWRRRTDAGWETAVAAAGGAQQQQIARSLGVTPSAVSQRLRASAYAEGEAGTRLAVRLLERMLSDGTVGGRG